MIYAIGAVVVPRVEALPDFRGLIAVSLPRVWLKQRCHPGNDSAINFGLKVAIIRL